MAMLSIRDLTKRYGDKTAVEGLTMEVDRGELCAFIGHNGAGKTTTLKCVAGILGFEEGGIYVDGVSVADQPILTKKKIAYIPDNPDIYEFMTGIKREDLCKKLADRMKAINPEICVLGHWVPIDLEDALTDL